ncbi:carbonic anhydrase [Natronobacterium gregoryi]|uniref:carbonic anhydrase n=2 Tax=Natronobacterium gregoryi TaxID=44930 RepID=L0AGC1_NATGS|nr:carbonic anhydrase [Natronobacterium gregoryi]AFZ72871.1 carbonic anhydrase [Natronobacterium gregoryi SP2]ELY69639.1 carbonic anhydrase [Natronobacterium gregoryi SP2]PLK21900.1 carbonic anhydrase [Natronobacterium gregoryi SP2]SFI66108.1 carbonic anhydrase [Natronobacterium gregoryi]
MSDDPNQAVLHELLAGNDDHVEGLADDYFDTVQDGQQPDVVAVCCSDSRVPQERMWGVDDPGTVFTPSNIGNQVWDEDEGERLVDGGVLYPLYHAGTDVAVVVGHTGCGAVTAAYEVATGGALPGPEGVDTWVEQLVPVVEEGLESDLVDTEAERETVINQLVEYNVDRQTRYLREANEVPDEVDIYGFVYDFQGVYGDEYGRAYLVHDNGVTEPDRIADRLPDRYETATRSLLY